MDESTSLENWRPYGVRGFEPLTFRQRRSKMGCAILKASSSSYDKNVGIRVVEVERRVEVPVQLPNPDPYNYVLEKSEQIGRFLIVEITYPDCTNYEGKKILMYEGITIKDLRKQKSIDPHFSSNKRFYSPIARFEPTEFGWIMAQKLARKMGRDVKVNKGDGYGLLDDGWRN